MTTEECYRQIHSLSKEGRNDYRTLTEEVVACLLALGKERWMICCSVTGRRRYSGNLPRQGLEIPGLKEHAKVK